MVREIYKRQTHQLCSLHTTSEPGMTAVGSYSPCELREGKLQYGSKNNSIGNVMLRIIGNGEEKENAMQTHCYHL